MCLDRGKAIPVNSVSEEYAYIAEHPCPACGGQWQLRMQTLLSDAANRHYDRLEVICGQCGRQQDWLFDIDSFFGKRLG